MTRLASCPGRRWRSPPRARPAGRTPHPHSLARVRRKTWGFTQQKMESYPTKKVETWGFTGKHGDLGLIYTV